MATSGTMGVRFTDEERHWINEYATFAGKTASEVIRESVLETIEDAIDIYEYNKALAEDDGTRYTMDEVMKMLGDA